MPIDLIILPELEIPLTFMGPLCSRGIGRNWLVVGGMERWDGTVGWNWLVVRGMGPALPTYETLEEIPFNLFYPV